MKVIAIVPAAGSGRRLGAREKKPFVRLCGKPLIVYALRSLASSGYIDKIIVATDQPSMNKMEGIIKRYRIAKVQTVTAGGSTRAGSVRNCFKLIKQPCDIVLIHDGARPFVSKGLIRDSVIAADKNGACIVAVRQTDTVKLAGKDRFIKKTLDRTDLWRAQTPQAFRYDILKKAILNSARSGNETDDASMAERIGKRVKILEGSPRNIKITTKEDLKIAEVLSRTFLKARG